MLKMFFQLICFILFIDLLMDYWLIDWLIDWLINLFIYLFIHLFLLINFFYFIILTFCYFSSDIPRSSYIYSSNGSIKYDKLERISKL